MAYLYHQYTIENDKKIPFYIGVSASNDTEEQEVEGNTPLEIIENFIKTPYIRMYDFGPKSIHGFKAKCMFQDAGEKSEEYQQFIEGKTYGKDFFAEILFQDEDLQYVYYLEFLTIAKWGLRKDEGVLFNKIPGGHELNNGKLVPLFSHELLTKGFMNGYLTYNPNFVVQYNNYTLNSTNLTKDKIFDSNTYNSVIKYANKRLINLVDKIKEKEEYISNIEEELKELKSQHGKDYVSSSLQPENNEIILEEILV